MPYVVYLRVSTQRQGDSGLGIQAQAEAVQRHADQVGQPIIATFVEIESGAQKERPELVAALVLCRQKRATLLIARLDRLSRSLSFIAQLLDSNVEITAADVPSANRMMLQMLGIFAEHERTLISARTKAALAAAKARGVKLGANGAALARVRKAEALAYAEGLRSEVQAGVAAGFVTTRAMAHWLNQRGIPSRAGREWSAPGVSRLLRRLEGYIATSDLAPY